MRVVSWNLGFAYGFKDTHDRAWHYLAALDPDLAFLQEVHPPAWAEARWTIEKGLNPQWGSAIVAGPGVRLSAFEGHSAGILGHFGSYLVTRLVALADGTSLVVASVHTPARAAEPAALIGLDPGMIRRPSVDVPWLNDLAYFAYRDLTQGKRFLITGDWNTARLWDKVHGGTAGEEFFGRAASDGWVECHRRFHPEEGRTWFRNGNQPYQEDHAFCDATTAERLRACDIDAYPAETLRLSDHAPLVMEFED